MKRKSQRSLLFAVNIAFLVLLFYSNVSYAAIIKPPKSVDSPLTESEIVEKANAAVAANGYNLAQLPLLETKATLVYNDNDKSYEWIVSHIVENEAEPYLVTIVNTAGTGEVLQCIKN
ncbi:MAG: hypothetical protein RSE23_05395 [Clostridia bacterium]